MNGNYGIQMLMDALKRAGSAMPPMSSGSQWDPAAGFSSGMPSGGTERDTSKDQKPGNAFQRLGQLIAPGTTQSAMAGKGGAGG